MLKIKYLPILFILFFLIHIHPVQAIDIYDCSILDQAGETYYLKANIFNSYYTRCMDIRANNIVLDCQNHLIDGINSGYYYGISITSGGVTVKNCRITDWFGGGIYIYKSGGNTITNIDTRNNLGYAIRLEYSKNNKFTNIYQYNSWRRSGIRLYYSDNNKFTNMTANDNHNDGIYLYYSNSNTFIDVTANDNSNTGIYISGNSNTFTNVTANSNHGSGIYISGNSNTFTNVTANSNSWDGIQLTSSSSFNTIKDSKFQGNGDYGIHVGQYGEPASNNIYNNLFNNRNNFYFDGTVPQNYWNTTNQTGDRIYGPGNFIGGNYWTNPAGNGYSDTCGDANKDGFCDTPYDVENDTAGCTSDNCDYLPLSLIVPGYCDEVIENVPFTITKSNAYYCLYQNHITGDTAITFGSGVQNSILDCLGYGLQGAGTNYGVLTESNIKDNTIKNCNITDFSNGIFLSNSPNNNTLTNNTVNNNFYGFVFSSASNNTLINNIANNNTYGFYFSFSSNNTLTNNTANNNNNYGFYFFSSSNNNTLTNNTVNNNNNYGFVFSSASNNTLINNIANNNTYGIYLSFSYYNNIRGGSLWGNTYDYRLRSTGTTNNFINTNFTAKRKIDFYDSSAWFNYNNETANGIWLKTNVSRDTTITRELVNWNQVLMQWNDTSNFGATARYNITGLIPNTNYDVYNNSVLAYMLSTDSNGNLESFTIYLSANEEHEIKVLPVSFNINLIGQLNYTKGSALENTQIKMIIKYQTSRYEITNTTDSLGFFYFILTDLPRSMFEPLPGDDFDIEFRVLGDVYKCNYNATTGICS